MMLRIRLKIVGVAVLLTIGVARAEEASVPQLRFGASAVLPLPGWNDAGIGLMPWGAIALPIGRGWAGTGRMGWVGHLRKTQSVGSETKGHIEYGSWELPVLVGLEYPSEPPTSLFVTAEVGYILRREHVEWEGEVADSTNHGVGFALGGGYRFGRLGAHAHLLFPNLPRLPKYKAVLLGLSWALPL